MIDSGKFPRGEQRHQITPTGKIAARAAKIGKRPRALRVAAPEDLLHLKEIAYADRKFAADAQDLEFLRNLLKERP